MQEAIEILRATLDQLHKRINSANNQVVTYQRERDSLQKRYDEMHRAVTWLQRGKEPV
jgi:chaperonin cofactor prefoldin